MTPLVILCLVFSPHFRSLGGGGDGGDGGGGGGGGCTKEYSDITHSYVDDLES